MCGHCSQAEPGRGTDKAPGRCGDPRLALNLTCGLREVRSLQLLHGMDEGTVICVRAISKQGEQGRCGGAQVALKVRTPRGVPGEIQVDAKGSSLGSGSRAGTLNEAHMGR